MGPSASAGRKLRAPISSTVPIRRRTKVGPVTGNEPTPGGTRRLAASDPAMARIGTIMRNRPISMAAARVLSYHGVLAVRPAKALPLFPVAEV